MLYSTLEPKTSALYGSGKENSPLFFVIQILSLLLFFAEDFKKGREKNGNCSAGFVYSAVVWFSWERKIQ